MNAISKNMAEPAAESERIHVIFDCDNTFGMPGRPADDGLALLYLLGKPRARLVGLTTTYGNGRVDEVYGNTKAMLKELGRSDIPVLKGAARGNRRDSEAAEFLADRANAHKGELSVLATGSLTNLYAAHEIDRSFFDNIKELVLMGGVTEALFLNGVGMDELNLSLDPEASYRVLTAGANISIMTGNNCLDSYMDHGEYRDRLMNADNPLGGYIYRKTESWFGKKNELYGLNGFYNWDATAAVYMLEKALFADRAHACDATRADLERGYLGTGRDPSARSVNLPVVRDAAALRKELYDSWLRPHV
ncbi:MAG: nucleoside hydrolase [Clostridiales Family XIII bacterium]|jgi:inosine-uridine nucleoside N-ribohydrolase|nr:nucleoside hydrolase [Clostridiales Family XIII bacterium]